MLAIECATPACSVALFEGGELIDHRHETLGRGHAERLVPMIAELAGKGEAQSICVGRGPGSFTGVRIALAAARALAIAWGSQVRGFGTLALVAAMARQRHPGTVSAGPVSVCMTGGHGEWFVQNFAADGSPSSPLASLPPNDAARFAAAELIAGDQAKACADLADGARMVLELLPDARAIPALPAGALSDQLAPLYGRAPDARLPA